MTSKESSYVCKTLNFLWGFMFGENSGVKGSK